MTMIKKDGHWVTVAGGQRMWVGTKAQLDAALAAGELEDGTAVMVTDDYEEDNLLAFEDVSFSKTLGAQGQDYATINVPAKSGYTAKMVSVKNMMGSVGTGAIICTAMLNSNATIITVIMHNQSNAGQDCTGNVTIMYVKN